MLTDETRLVRLTACTPASMIVAPMMPPISAWLELDGIERYHVIRFQVIAPTSAASTSTSPSVPTSSFGLMIPLAIVAATSIEMKAPAKLSTAEIPTATRGFRAPVAIEVAIAFAVSWNPLVKSNESPPTITSTRMISAPIGRGHYRRGAQNREVFVNGTGRVGGRTVIEGGGRARSRSRAFRARA